ncbi:MAG TPA: PAS domain-containing sensor histidine kinase, partial [Verrucomicrobiae bacterium]
MHRTASGKTSQQPAGGARPSLPSGPDLHSERLAALNLLEDAIIARQETERVNDALRQSENRLSTLTDAVPQIIWTNSADGTANYFNKRWYEYSGLSFEESVVRGWEAIVHPDDAPASKAEWDRALARGKIFDCEYRLRGAGGTYRWFIGRNVPLRNSEGRVIGWFGTATDIQDLKETQAALHASEEQFRLIVENAREYAIFAMDLERRITIWNTGAQGILGYSQEEVIGQSADIIFIPAERADGAPEREAARALAEGRASDERWHVRKDQSRFWASGVMTAMRGACGEAIGLVKIFRDQTELKQTAEALVRSRQELEAAFVEMRRAREEAEAANSTKDRFLAALSHELRTPLTPVLGVAETLLKRQDLPPRVVEGLQMICRNVERQTHFINDLLDLTRISRGKLELVCEEMNLHDAVQVAVEVSLPDIQGKQQQLSIELNARHSMAFADVARAQQVFWNLLKNASKFTPEHGSIRVVSRDEPGAIVVEISDTGIGIDSNVMPKIFEAFQQGDTSITRRFGGLGLGLTIAKATVEAHGGSITATSAGTGQGATFSV